MVVNRTDAKCIQRVTKYPDLAAEMNRTCSCDPECAELEYHTVVSSMRWPSDNYWHHLAEEYGIMYLNETVNDDDVHLLQQANLQSSVMNFSAMEKLEKVSRPKDFQGISYWNLFFSR